MTVVYIDTLILINFIANYLLLLGAGRVTGARLCRRRIAIAAIVGALYAATAFWSVTAWLILWPCKLCVGALLPLIAYGGEPRLLKVTLVFFAAAAGLAGLILAVRLFGGTMLTLENGVMYSNFDLRLLILLFVLCYFVMSLLFRRAGRHCSNELIELKIVTDKRTVGLTALLDSGHTITDPVTNLPVVIADYVHFVDELPVGTDPAKPIESLKQCRTQNISSVRLVPYRAVGVECGMLLAFRVNSVMIDGRNLGSLLVALSPTPVSDGGSYQALIGGI